MNSISYLNITQSVGQCGGGYLGSFILTATNVSQISAGASTYQFKNALELPLWHRKPEPHHSPSKNKSCPLQCFNYYAYHLV